MPGRSGAPARRSPDPPCFYSYNPPFSYPLTPPYAVLIHRLIPSPIAAASSSVVIILLGIVVPRIIQIGLLLLADFSQWAPVLLLLFLLVLRHTNAFLRSQHTGKTTSLLKGDELLEHLPLCSNPRSMPRCVTISVVRTSSAPGALPSSSSSPPSNRLRLSDSRRCIFTNQTNASGQSSMCITDRTPHQGPRSRPPPPHTHAHKDTHPPQPSLSHVYQSWSSPSWPPRRRP